VGPRQTNSSTWQVHEKGSTSGRRRRHDRAASGHGKRDIMRKPIKYVEKAVTFGAKGAWAVYDRLNRIKPNPSPTPKWSDKPLLKSYQKSKPPLGWPRSTDSLCPKCVPEIRQQILDGKLPYEVLMN